MCLSATLYIFVRYVRALRGMFLSIACVILSGPAARRVGSLRMMCLISDGVAYCGVCDGFCKRNCVTSVVILPFDRTWSSWQGFVVNWSSNVCAIVSALSDGVYARPLQPCMTGMCL